jgi:hypothetical protein
LKSLEETTALLKNKTKCWERRMQLWKRPQENDGPP